MAAALIGREVVAVAGVARHDFPDHPFRPHEVEALIEEAARRRAILVATERTASGSALMPAPSRRCR
ncbi:hypothetical protein DFR50_12722 [Roseiarcus fermentans]|uniref:Tetraacyldisaccharide 4'-kinase n=1 Tax=Roseiarcus fermentans TaxID=1473586 RepID=A0A366EYB5_9HYPH|nr:hypothetical protein [Roseiarcus fermentans]RBP07377.1 hypothetical protein DFR50_12722 [Roseiarcus fermentans]